MTRRIRDQRGFALPAVIFLVALLTLLLTSGLTRVEGDRQIATASEEATFAFAIAQNGLQAYMGSVTARPPDGDSVRINVTGGYANVVAHLIRQPADTAARHLYLIRSTGIAINPAVGSAPQARRTVAQYAEWQTGSIDRRAVLTAPNGLQKHGGSALLLVRGDDACHAEPPIPGVRTTYMTGPPTPVPDFQGNPGLIEEGAGTGPTIAGQTDVDWAAVLGGAISPDYTSFRQGDFTFPIQIVPNDLLVEGVSLGTGLLVVPGDLTIAGTFFYFEGVILVGGQVDFDADFAMVRGLMITGLNEQLGTNPQRTEIGGGGDNLYLYFDSCKINQALAPLTGLAPVQNAWLDNWAVY